MVGWRVREGRTDLLQDFILLRFFVFGHGGRLKYIALLPFFTPPNADADADTRCSTLLSHHKVNEGKQLLP